MSVKAARETLRASMLQPQPRPFIVDAAVRYGQRRKRIMTQADIGRMEAVKCGAGRLNFCEEMQ